MAKAKKIRPTYRERDQEEIRKFFRAAIPEGSAGWDYLCGIKMESVKGNSEFERGVAEGMRECAELLLQMAISRPVEVTVRKNQEDR